MLGSSANVGRLVIACLCLVVTAACEKQAAAPSAGGRTEIAIKVDAVGYHPAEARAPGGKPVRIVFTRTTDDGCGQELLVPSAGLKKDLPLNQPVPVDLTMPASGKLAFSCGMDMYRGAIIAD
jgi:plastocyanin domain-containing protein